MPELYGICRSKGLTPDDLEGFEAMARDLRNFRQGRHEVQRVSWAACAIVSWHASDSAILERENGAGVSYAWIGNTPEETGDTDLAEIADAISHENAVPVDRIDPPFAGCVMEENARTLWIITDPYGHHPLYYACQRGLLVFCTKVAPILRSGLVQWKLDASAVLDFFTYEHVTGNRTFADSVSLVPPSTVLSFTSGRTRFTAYSPLPDFDRSGTMPVRKTSDRLYAELYASVGRALARGSRPAVTLSGGMDSRALLGLAVRHRPNVRAYTFGSPDCRDVVYARRVAAECGVPHTFIEIDGSYLPKWLDHGIFVTGGMVSCIHYHILSLGDVLLSEADVVLDGLSGDALVGGNIKWGMVLTSSAQRACNSLYRQRATAWPSRHARGQLFQRSFLRSTDYDPRQSLEERLDHATGDPPWRLCYRFDITERQRRFIQYGPHLLRPLLAVQAPFYGGSFPQVTAQLPAKQLLEQRAYLHMHADHLPELARIPDTARGISLSCPQAVRFGKKIFDFGRRHLSESIKGLLPRHRESATDYPGWFRTELADFLQGRLLDRNSGLEGIVRRTAVERLLNEHLRAQADHSVKIGCLLTFGAWLKSIQRTMKTRPFACLRHEASE